MKILREPLLHFLLLGGVLFVVFEFAGRPAAEEAPVRAERISVTPGLIENLVLSFENSTERKPTAEELATLIEEFIREEILTREAIALGLHHDDPIVRRQLRRRVEYNQAASAAPPTEEELQAFHAQNAAQFRRRGAPPDAPLPAFDEVRAAVVRAWEAERTRQELDAAYTKLRERYEIVIENAEATP